jgi:1,4-dihydroxy-2-naphthoyl-CoA hydrolase
MRTPADFNEWSQYTLPGHLGIETLVAEHGHLVQRLEVEPHLMAPNGYLHAGTITALADTAAGYGCVASLPETASGFTTIELKANYIGTAREGGIRCEARMVHEGRTTQVWDSTVTRESDDKVIAMVRVTQMVLYPKS